MKKRVLSLFLAITLCLSLTPTGALAAEGQPPEQMVTATQEAQIPAPALEEKEEEKTTPAQTGAGENASPAKPEENPTEDAPAAAEKNTVDKEAGKEAGQNEPTVEGENEPLALGLDDAGQNAADGENGEAGGTPISEGDTRTEIWCTMKPSLIQRSYDGTTDGTIPIDLTFTDGTNTFTFEEGTGFTAKKTFDSADAGSRTVTVEIELIGDAAAKYKLKAGEETFTIGGYINKAYPDLTVSLSKTACTAGEKLLPLLSLSGVKEDAAVTYYYTPYKMLIGDSEHEGRGIPAIDENTVIDKLDEEGNNTYYVYARTAATQNYQEGMSNVLEFTVAEKVDPVASVTSAAGTETTYGSFPDAWTAAIANNGSTLKLLADATLPNGNTDLDQSLTLDLNGYVLGSNGSLTVKSSAALTVRNAGAENSKKPAKAGLYLTLLVEKGGSFTCTDGGLRYLGLLSAGTGDYAIQLTEGESHCTFGGFAQGDANATVGDLLKATPGMALHGDNSGSDVRIERSTLISSGFTYFSFYVGPCSEHQMDAANGTCIYCGASYAASVTASGGVTTNYTSLDDALDAMKDGDTVTLLGNAEVTRWHSLSKAFTLELNGKTVTTQSNAELYLHARVIVQDSSAGKNGGMAGTYLLNVQSNGDLIIRSGTFNGRIAINDGKLTINGGTFNQEVALPRGDSDSVFFSGGTFAKIWYPNSSGSFLDLLADGYAFYDKNGKLVNAAKITDTNLYNVRIRPHQHTFTNGACACGYTCPHTSVDESGACTVCGKQFAASITEGDDVTYYDTFNGALVYAYNNDGCTLKLLADVTEAAVMINNPFLFDLNGHNVGALSVDARATIKDSGTKKGKIGKVTVSTHKVPDLTLGDLLEEGYAFQYENGHWANDSHLQTSDGLSVTVEKAPIQSVKIYAKDKNNKEVSTIAYGTTGKVTLVSSCRMGETSGADLSYLWYKLGGFAATAPLEGATGANYTLPDNLTAGTHTYLLICTSDGYSKSAEITVTVTPVSLAGAEVTVQNPTYNGKEQSPTVTVKLGDKTLSRDNDYTMEVTKQTDAGSYKLTIKGGGNYTGTIEKDWKIEPVKIDHVEVSSDISKTYDGTATVTKTAEEWAKVLTFKTLSAYDVVGVPSDAYTISDAYFVEKSGEETIHSPDAGEKYGITFKIALKSSNYILQNYYDEEPAETKEITQSGGAKFTIEQANVTSPGEITQLVFNDLAKTYTLNLAALLPELSEGCEYGDIQYQGCDYHFTDSTYLDSNNGMSVSKEGILTLPTVSAHTSDVNTQIGTITVPVVTTNYQKFEFTIKVVISARIPLNASGVTVSASEITYGQALNESKLTATGTMKHPGTGEEVKGTFAWKNGTVKPDASDSYEAEWTFTPAAGYEEYAPATGTVTVKVKPAKLTVSVKASRMYYTGEAQIASIIASGQSVDSTPVTFTYSDKVDGNYTSGGPTFTDAGTYTVYYKAEAANHEPATGTFTVTIEPLPISLLSVSSISKTYDGSADVTLTADKLTFISNTAKATIIKLPDTALSFSNAQFTSKQEDGSYLPSPEVGGGKALSFTMMLTSNNYVFEGESGGTVSDVFETDNVNRFTITKAAAPTMQPIELTVINGLAKTYLVNLPALPTLGDNCKYGSIKYEACNFDLIGEGGYANSTAMITSNDEFQLTVPAVESQTEGSVGTVGVKITTDNYQDMLLTIEVIAKNKIVPVLDGEITATPITFGQILRVSTIIGTMKDDGKPVEGTFEWTNPSTQPDKAGDYQAEWTFTPAEGYEEYATVTGTVTIKVNKADIPTKAITAPTAQENLTYTGQEQALITAGMTDYGTMQYSLTENGTYSQDIPTGTDAGAYTVWYRVFGDTNHNDTAPASVTVRIGKKPLTITGVTATSKPYDGTTNADISSVTFDNVTLNRGTDYTVTASFNDAGVDNGKNVTATVTLMGQAAKNYFLEQSSFTTTASITKAAAPGSGLCPAVTVINDLAKTYEMVLSNDYLPKLSSPCEYGNVSYSLRGTYLTDGYKDTVQVKVMEENGQYKLKLTVPAVDYDKVSSVGTIDVRVTSDNYRDFYLTIGVKTKNKDVPVPDGTISASDITYGQALNDSKIAGKMKAGGKAIDGTFTWTNGAFKPAAGDYTASWTFTPAEGYEEYATATGIVTVTVNRKAVTVSGITARNKVYDGNTNATLDYSKVTLNGVLENDTLTVTATGTLKSADVGEQKVTISDLTLGGDSATNYVLAESGNQTETTATITAREVTVTITPNGGTYGSVTAAAAVLSGVVDGETVPVTLTYTGNGYNSTSVPTDVDSYTVTASIADSNYILTGETTANFVITPKTVIVSGITAKDKAYDGTTNATLDFSNAKFDGILENDKLTVTAKGVFEKTEAGKWNVAISDLTLGGNSVANYVLAESGNQTETTATITAKQITVSITPNGGTYGETITPATVKTNDVVGEDTPTITLTYTGTANDGTEYTGTTPPTKAGTYTVTATTTDHNYTLDPDTTTADFTIAKRPATVTPDNKTKVYEEKDPDLTYAVSGVLDGETLEGITLTRTEGENAGEYAITATADADANPNYEVTFAEGKFTINPKSIDGATVKLGKALTANGAEQTQTVEKVLLDGKELPADSYTVAGNTATAPGSHTLTITAKGNYTGTVEQTYVIAPAKAEDAPGEEIAIGSGEVKVVVKSEGAVPPATLLTNKAELLAMLVDNGDITADELAQIADGASVDIALTVKEANVPDEVKTAMAQAAKGCTIGQYLDISLFKYMTVNGSQQAGVALRTTKNALTISVAVPDALINTNSAVNRTYCIVRNHEGTITVLDATFDAASKTLTFKTDRFSDYAIAYKDTAVPGSGSNPSSNNSSNDSESKKNEVAAPTPAPTPASTSKPSTITAMPQTGDTSNPTLYVVLLVASLLGLAVVFVCKKRNDK